MDGTELLDGQSPVEIPGLHPLILEPGCNNDPSIIRDQLRENIKLCLPWLEVTPAHDRTLAIIGGGPSLVNNIGRIYRTDTDILALNGAYGYLLDYGIKPDYWMLLDTRAENLSFLENINHNTMHFVAAQCHPEIFRKLSNHKITMYLTTLPGVLELVKHLDVPKNRLVGSAGTVGTKALSLAYALGYRKLHLYGYDSSYSDDKHHAFTQTLNDTNKTIDIHFNGERYVTTPAMANQAYEFLFTATDLVKFHGFDIELYGSGLLYDMVANANELGKIPLASHEKAKYEKMWEVDRYRKDAPGEDHVERARKYFLGQKVIDFGCGTGRAAQKLQDLHYHVTGIDHASNCRDQGTTFKFIEACLWELPISLHCDWGFCTDVMEHIPTEKVMDVLKEINSACRDGVYFNIATSPDVMGSIIGQRLHLTVMAKEEWQKALKAFWADVSMIDFNEDEVTFVVRTNEPE